MVAAVGWGGGAATQGSGEQDGGVEMRGAEGGREGREGGREEGGKQQIQFVCVCVRARACMCHGGLGSSNLPPSVTGDKMISQTRYKSAAWQPSDSSVRATHTHHVMHGSI